MPSVGTSVVQLTVICVALLRTAEQVKIDIGSAYLLDEPRTIEIKGRDLMEGVPKSVVVSDEEIREALDECINIIINKFGIIIIIIFNNSCLILIIIFNYIYLTFFQFTTSIVTNFCCCCDYWTELD